jgi:two-component system sensor histidine kinase ResE
VLLQVVDNGSGIAAEDIPFIFERSFRSDQARLQYSGETGLGLAIAKSLVDLHGGSLSVHSELNQGATFTISLPVPASQ